MSDATPSAHGALTGPATITIQRLLPGPIGRIWAYLTQDELRRTWLAAGQLVLTPGAPFTFVWRNDELSDRPGERPPQWREESTLTSEVIAVDAPHRLVIGWGDQGEVTFDLAERGDKVLLTVTHRRLPDRGTLLGVSAGWHTHLDMLAARLDDKIPAPFWTTWAALHRDYDLRFPD